MFDDVEVERFSNVHGDACVDFVYYKWGIPKPLEIYGILFF